MKKSKTPPTRWRRFQVAVLFACLLIPLPLPAQAALTPDQFEDCLLTKINADRSAVGAQPLTMATDRVPLARDWSAWMSENTFRHMTSEERAPLLPEGTWTWAENIARRSDTSGDCSYIHNMLMNSSGHRANILDPAFRFVALGAHNSSGWWVTQVFFDAPNYPPPPVPDPCPGGATCDTAAFHDWGGQFHLRDNLGSTSTTTGFYFGNPGDTAFSGDWNCDGVDTPGLYRRSDGYVYLRNSNSQGVADIRFFFGNPGDFPIAGDFDGDGCDTVSIYRPSEQAFYIINRLGVNDGGLGPADYSFIFGNPGDKPFSGDFDGDRIDEVGLHRESTGRVYFRYTLSTGVAHNDFIFGNPGDKLLAGDWDGDGDDTVGVYRPSTGRFYAKMDNSAGFAEITLIVGTRFNTAVPIHP